MKVVAVIAEYNPFHNGHQYNLTAAKELAGAAYSLGVISGSFLQRGEPALVNKWIRAEMALAAGMDLVVELPTAFATRSAQIFAEGAIRLLDATGIVTHLCFGSELGSLTPLAEVASLVLDEPQELSLLIKKQLEQGLVYPRARAQAIVEYVSLHKSNPQRAWGEILASPNNILGIEYLRALKLINSAMEPLTIPRKVSGHHDTELSNSDSIASATSIRISLRKQGHKGSDLQNFVPEGTWNCLNREFSAGRGPVYLEDLFPYLIMKLRTGTVADLSQIVDVAEGLEFRIWEAAQKATSFEMLVDAIKTKRYTRTRIQRILVHYLLGYSADLAKSFQLAGPKYLRVLGFSDRGRILLRKMQERAQLPIVTKITGLMKTPGVAADMLALDVLATNVHTMLYPNSSERLAGIDYFHAPVNVSQQ